MLKKPSFKIVIQTSAIGWDGANDLSLSIIDKQPALYWILKKTLQNWPNIKIVLACPKRDHDSQIKKIVSQLDNNNISISWGSNDDVLNRLIESSKELEDDDYILRILGVHYFFDPNISKKLLAHVFKDNCDWAKPPDDFEIQLTSEVIKVKALRDLDQKLKKGGNSEEKVIRVTPAHYIANFSNRTSGHIVNKLPLISSKKKKVMRNKALKIYRIDRTEVNVHKASAVGSQLTFHYNMALKYINKNSSILDIACAEGFGTKILSRVANIVIGVDIDNKIIKQAQVNNSATNIIYQTGDAHNLSFSDNTFDAVVSMETVEHVAPKKFLPQLKRVLKPSGILLLSTPQNRNGNIPLNPFHNKEYSLKEIKKIISKYFQIVQIIGIKTGRLVIKDDPIGTNTFIIAKNLK